MGIEPSYVKFIIAQGFYKVATRDAIDQKEKLQRAEAVIEAARDCFDETGRVRSGNWMRMLWDKIIAYDSEDSMSDDTREALEDMVWQFAYRGNDKRRRWLHTGGLSALEEAFAALGWDDPHYVTDGGCEIKGCSAWATAVARYPRSMAKNGVKPRSMIGHGHLCSEHYRRWNGRNAEQAEDLGRIGR